MARLDPLLAGYSEAFDSLEVGKRCVCISSDSSSKQPPTGLHLTASWSARAHYRLSTTTSVWRLGACTDVYFYAKLRRLSDRHVAAQREGGIAIYRSSHEDGARIEDLLRSQLECVTQVYNCAQLK